ncbi:neck protein [Synechococcus phage S-MbCM6]|uniref:Neck protein n=2 Tax=Namakavirus smbcm6 TaxID=2734120 RepID=A0A0E3F9K8_9CAUD|nr:neck protein [Synechococcus phage ACG-2014c]AIX38088.1 neck protein [Synechococcus phage ACG-2014c]
MTYRNDPPENCIQSDYTSSCRLNLNGSSQEQMFMGNLIIESIELYGQDIYYLPRTYVNRDTILNEVETSNFTQALSIRAYVNNVEGWEGQGDLLSKFGVRIEDKTTFIFSRSKFTEKVDDNAALNVEGRPNEGDLIWFPTTNHLFEIQFVEAERPFYQLGKGYVWECQCELFEYSDEQLDTGVAAIDAIETAFANSIKLVMDAGGTGAFTVGEEIVGDLYLAKATATLTSGVVSAITLTDGGEYYKSALPPTVTISAPPASGGITAFSTSTDTGSYSNPTGTGYTVGTYTTTNLTGTGSGAIATVSGVNGSGGLTVSGGDLSLTNLTGTGYSTGDVLRINGGDDNAYIRVVSVGVTSPASATATVSSAGIVTDITITSGGTGYTSVPTVTIDYSPKDSRAEVKSWNASTRELQVINRTGTFNTAETITGLTSGARWSPESYNTLNNTNTADSIDQNYSFETADDDIIDFTEGNPFGSIGSVTDTTI